MLDPFIIEEIRRREEAERRDEWRPVLEMPMEMPRPPMSDTSPEPVPEEERGVVILDFSI
jgi:hypothetical protein